MTSGIGAARARHLTVRGLTALLGGLTGPTDVALTVGHVALDATAMPGTVIHMDGGCTAR